MLTANQGRVSTMKPPMMRVPEWVQPEQYQMFACRLAAVYHNPTGSLGKLSLELGGSVALLHTAVKANNLTPATCIKLEELLGRDLFPREFFRPDIFLPEG